VSSLDNIGGLANNDGQAAGQSSPIDAPAPAAAQRAIKLQVMSDGLVSHNSADRRVREAVVLAAGNGLRLAAQPHAPKPLLRVGDRPLLGHVLDCLETSGIHRVHVVVGYGADAIRGDRDLVPPGVDVRWLHNPRYNEPNGLSLLCAHGSVTGPFLLLMADHLLDPRTIARLIYDRGETPRHAIAVDLKTDLVFDLNDATLVRQEDGLVRHIAKRLPDANAVDTGLFLLTPEVFDAVDASVGRGDASLTGAIAVLADRRAIDTWDVGRARWIDVDTQDAAVHAEQLLRSGLVGAAAHSEPATCN
jgi:choline kinase